MSWSRQPQAGDISEEAVLASYMPIPTLVSPPGKAWAVWWKEAFGWSLLTRRGDDQQWLPYEHPDMSQSRAATQALIDEQGVHRFLILNFDQIWRSSWSMEHHKLHYKDRRAAGARGKKRKIQHREAKKVHAVKGSRRSMTVTKFELL